MRYCIPSSLSIFMDDCTKILLFLSYVREDLCIEKYRKVFNQKPFVHTKLHKQRLETQSLGELLQRMPQISLNVYIGQDSEASNAMIEFQWALTCNGRIFDLDGETSQDNIQKYLRSELLRRNMGEDNPGVYRIKPKPASELTRISVNPWIEQGIKSIFARVFDAPFLDAATAPVATSGAVRRRI